METVLDCPVRPCDIAEPLGRHRRAE
jgi:hypothetical protein